MCGNDSQNLVHHYCYNIQVFIVYCRNNISDMIMEHKTNRETTL